MPRTEIPLNKTNMILTLSASILYSDRYLSAYNTARCRYNITPLCN